MKEDINLNLYKVFYVVATSKTFNDAANKLYVSQPAISKQIRNLENILDVKLFYRLSKGIELTKEGKILLEQVEKIFYFLDVSREKILLSKNMMLGEIVIGCPSHIASFYLMDFIEKFRSEHPDIQIVVDSSSTSNLINKLEHHKIDFVIDSLPIDIINKNVIIKSLKKLDTTFIVSNDYKQEINKIEDLNNKTFILPPLRSPLRKKLETYLKKYNLKMNTGLTVDTTDLIISSVKRNIGIGYVIKDAVRFEIENKSIKEINIDYKLPNVELNLLYLDGYLSYQAKIFLEEYIKVI